jgi:hypothetical protein
MLDASENDGEKLSQETARHEPGNGFSSSSLYQPGNELEIFEYVLALK